MRHAASFHITKAEIMEIMRQHFEGIKPEEYPNEFYAKIASDAIDAMTFDMNNQILAQIEGEFARADKAMYEAFYGL